MTTAIERVEKLRENFLTKDQAIEKASVFENCQELLVKGKTKFDFHPTVGNTFVMSHGTNEYLVSQESFVKLCRLVGVPSTYAEKMPAQFLFPHLSYWLADGDVGVKAFIRPTNGSGDQRPKIAGFAKEDAFYYPLSRILEQVDKVRPDYLVEGLTDVTWRDTTFGLIFPETEFMVDVGKNELKRGDHLFGGVKVRTSLLGEFPSKVAAFFMTLVCLNGMISRDEIYTFNRRLGFEGLDEWLVDGVTSAIGALESEIGKVRRLADIDIPDEAIPPYISHMFDQMGINQKTREAVLGKLVERHPRNLYDLMNAITEVAHTIENRREVYTLQALGGFVTSHAESCERCHRPF
jgi:hypothetical protein